jgi:hypothetical protein
MVIGQKKLRQGLNESDPLTHFKHACKESHLRQRFPLKGGVMRQTESSAGLSFSVFFFQTSSSVFFKVFEQVSS